MKSGRSWRFLILPASFRNHGSPWWELNPWPQSYQDCALPLRHTGQPYLTVNLLYSKLVGSGGFEPPKLSQLIYSQSHLSTLVTAQVEEHTSSFWVIDGHIIADCPYAVKYFFKRFPELFGAHKISSAKRDFVRFVENLGRSFPLSQRRKKGNVGMHECERSYWKNIALSIIYWYNSQS